MAEFINFGKEAIKKVVIVGPESTGKSTLAPSLAKHYDTVWVPEFARKYLDRLNRDYTKEDLIEIAKGQLANEHNQEKKANNILICDTNILTIKIWSDYKYGGVDDQILDILNKQKYDLYLLTFIDTPWEEDPQREHPDLREFFYSVYKNELTMLSFPFVEIKGDFYERKKSAIEAIDSLLL